MFYLVKRYATNSELCRILYSSYCYIVALFPNLLIQDRLGFAVVDLVAPPRGRVAPAGESASIAFVEAPIPVDEAPVETPEGQEWDEPAGLSPIMFVTPLEEPTRAPSRRGRRSRRRRVSGVGIETTVGGRRLGLRLSVPNVVPSLIAATRA